jgi:hypothetical protein
MITISTYRANVKHVRHVQRLSAAIRIAANHADHHLFDQPAHKLSLIFITSFQSYPKHDHNRSFGPYPIMYPAWRTKCWWYLSKRFPFLCPLQASNSQLIRSTLVATSEALAYALPLLVVALTLLVVLIRVLRYHNAT